MQHLPDLIWLSQTFFALNINAGIPRPGRFKNAMTATSLARLSKVVLTNFSQFGKANPFWVLLHLPENFSQTIHK